MDGATLVMLQENIVPLVVAVVLCMPVSRKLLSRFSGNQIFTWVALAGLFLLFFVSVSYIVKGFYNPFLYFNF